MTNSFTANTSALLHAPNFTKHQHHHFKHSNPLVKASSSSPPHTNVIHRRKIVTTLLSTSLALGQLHGMTSQEALAEPQKWGTRSFLREKFFEPDLSPEDSVARIKQTAEGLHSMRDMLENMSWRYVIFYIRLKQAYLDKDLTIAMATLPKGLHQDYIRTANELVENMALLDSYVRTPKVYESYVYYEKTLKSIDDVVAILA